MATVLNDCSEAVARIPLEARDISAAVADEAELLATEPALEPVLPPPIAFNAA